VGVQQIVDALIDTLRGLVGRSEGVRTDASERPIRVDNVRRAIAGPTGERTKLLIQNTSDKEPAAAPANHFFSIGSKAVAFDTGIRIEPGGSYIDDEGAFRGEWFAVSDIVGPIYGRVREEN